MKALVVFESMFGNTAAIAEAVADGLAPLGEVEIVHVGAAPHVIGSDVGLIVVGGPTHAFGMTRPGTRRSARQQGAVPPSPRDIGIREWLEQVHVAARDATAAVFDTRMRSRLAGSAARGARKRLLQLGLPLVLPPASFIVTGTSGPLLDGEVDRARRWGAELAGRLPVGQH